MKAEISHQGVHLGEEELVDVSNACPLCLAHSSRESVFRIQNSPTVDLQLCPVCRGYSASRMPRPEVLERLYSTYYVGKEDKLTLQRVDYFASHIVRRITTVKSSEFRILDFGGGDGALARRIADRLLDARKCDRVEIQLIDYCPPGNYATERISIRSAHSLSEATGQFELVVASAILEHIPEANAALRQLFGFLRGGGYFYARTPCMAPMAKLLRNFDLTYPFHVHDLGSGFWNRVLETYNLSGKIVESGPAPVGTRLSSAPAVTIAAYCLKLPGWIEQKLSPLNRKDRLWNLVGGWEIFLEFENSL